MTLQNFNDRSFAAMCHSAIQAILIIHNLRLDLVSLNSYILFSHSPFLSFVFFPLVVKIVVFSRLDALALTVIGQNVETFQVLQINMIW